MTPEHREVLDPNRTVVAAVQVLPLADDAYPIIDKAIEAIAASGVKYEVKPMETAMEGTLDQMLEVARKAHLACLDAGADKVVTIIKISDERHGTSMAEKMKRYQK